MKALLQKWYGKTERLRQTEIREKYMFYLLLAALIVLLVPMLAIARYNVPAVDDYACFLSHGVWNETHSLLAVLRTGMKETIKTYYTWQGNFSVVLPGFISNPTTYDVSLYPVSTCLYLFALCLCVGRFCVFLFHDVFGGTKRQAGIVAIVILAACTQLLPSPAEGFYWRAGAFMYTFYFSLSLLLYTGVLGCLLRARSTPPSRHGLRIAGLSLIAFLVGGSNYTSALLTAVFFVCVMLVMLWDKQRRRPALLIPCVLFFLAFALNVLAPGNAVRQSAYAPVHPSAPLAILLSFRFAFSYAVQWLKLPLLCLLVLLVPVLYHIAGKTAFTFRLPLLVFGFSFCLLAAAFCPPVYAGDSAGPARLVNIIFFSFVLLLVFDLFYLLGWLRRSLSKWRSGDISLSEHLHGRMRYSLVFLGAVAVVFLLGSLYPRQATFTSTSALRSLMTGEAAAYYNTTQERIGVLSDDSQKDVTLPRFPCKPYLLYFDDITEDPSDWRNGFLAGYYGKDSVVLAAPDTAE